MFFQCSFTKEPVNIGVEGDVEFGVEAAIIGCRGQCVQVFPALRWRRLGLIAREVFEHVFVETHDHISKIHFIQLAQLLFAQAIAFAVVRLGGDALTPIDMPAAECGIRSDNLCARPEEGRVFDGFGVGEQCVSHGGIGDA